MSAVSECYATMTNPFGALGPFYDSLGHRGADYRRYRGQTVVAYESGTVRHVGWSNGIGRVVAVELDSGHFVAWAHLYDVRVRVGQRVSPGTVLALVAGGDDDPGSLWDGAHIHTTRSAVSAYNAAYGVRPLLDPVPGITAAIRNTSSPAGDGNVPVFPAEEKDDDMATKNSGFYYTRAANKAVVYLIANTESGFCSEYSDGRPNVAMPSTYNAAVAAAFGTGSFAPITEGHATAIKRSLTVVDDDPVRVELDPATLQALADLNAV